MERKPLLTILALLVLTGLAGCQALSPLNFLSPSRGLPPQRESAFEADE